MIDIILCVALIGFAGAFFWKNKPELGAALLGLGLILQTFKSNRKQVAARDLVPTLDITPFNPLGDRKGAHDDDTIEETINEIDFNKHDSSVDDIGAKLDERASGGDWFGV